jgi:hypothetical protein
VTFTSVLTINLNYIQPFLLSPLSPFLRTISTSIIVPFSSINTRYFHHIHPSLMPSPLPLAPILGQDLLYFHVFHFFKKTILLVYDSYTGDFNVLDSFFPPRPTHFHNDVSSLIESTEQRLSFKKIFVLGL